MATISRDNIILEIDARTQKFEQDLSRTEKKVDTFSTKISRAGKVLAGVFAVAGAGAAISAISRFAQASIKAIDGQLKAEAKLTAALKGREDVTKRLAKQASELQKKTLFGDEVTIEAQARLATILGTNEKAISQLIPLVQDFATAKNVDLATAAELVAKTLGTETNALSRYGIQVEGAANSTQRLESLSGNLARQVGGQATAAFKAGAGAVEAYHNIVGDLQEEIGRFLLPFVNRLASALSDTVSSIIEFIAPTEKLTDTIEKQRVEFNLQIGTLANLTKRLDDTSLSAEQSNNVQSARRDLITEINREYAPYLDNLLTEKSSIEDIEKAQVAANNAFKQRLLFIAFEDEIAEITKRGADALKTAAQAERGIARLRTERLGVTSKLSKEESDFVEILEGQAKTIRDGALETANSTDQIVAETTASFDKLAGELGTTLDAISDRFSNFGQTVEKGKDGTGGTGKKIKEQVEIGAGSLAELQEKLSFLQDALQRAPADPQILKPLALAVERAKIDIEELEAKIRQFTESREAIDPIKTLEKQKLAAITSQTEVGKGELEAFKKRQVILNKEREKEIQDEIERRMRLAKDIEQLEKDITSAIVGNLQQTNNERIKAVDAEIELQQRRVDQINNIDSKATAEQIELEEERLAKLTAEREKFVQKQRALAAIEIAINSAATIPAAIRAITEGFGENFLTGILKAASLAATIASTVAAVRGALSGVPAFAEGTERVKGPGTHKSDSIPAWLSKNERVVPADVNSRIGYDFPNSELGKAVQFYKTFHAPGPSDQAINAPLQVVRVDNSDLISEVVRMRKALNAMSIQFNVDDDGIYAAVTKAEYRIAHKKALSK